MSLSCRLLSEELRISRAPLSKWLDALPADRCRKSKTRDIDTTFRIFSIKYLSDNWVGLEQSFCAANSLTYADKNGLFYLYMGRVFLIDELLLNIDIDTAVIALEDFSIDTFDFALLDLDLVVRVVDPSVIKQAFDRWQAGLPSSQD